MATKPTKVPTWNSGGTNNTEPTSGQKIAGWAVDDVPPSSTFNWLQKLTGEWAAYLDDGDFTEGITVTGGVVVTGENGGGASSIGILSTGGSGTGGHGLKGVGGADVADGVHGFGGADDLAAFLQCLLRVVEQGVQLVRDATAGLSAERR